MAQIGVLRTMGTDRHRNLLGFHCPGCDGLHVVNISPGRWGFNGNHDKPTFTPSILVRYDGPDAGQDGAPPAVCHSFVTDGQIQFLSDCTHELAGQTVPLTASE